MHPRPRRRGCVIFLMITLLVCPLPAVASNFGSTGSTGTAGTTNGVFLSDNRYYEVGRISMLSTYSSGVYSAANNQYGLRTDLYATIRSPSSCDFSVQDVCVYDYYYGDNGYQGWNACAGGVSAPHPDMVCYVQYVKINLSYAPDPEAIACHELGHTLGLRHTSSTSTCLYNPPNSSRRTISSHDIDHINARY